jgi:hypothetical protein
LLPVPETHAHHKAAGLLALRVVQSLPADQRPIVLGATALTERDTLHPFTQLKSYAETKVEGSKPMYSFDKMVPFGYKGKLNYQMIVNWEIAEHKSQGTMQLGMNQSAIEYYWFFSINKPEDKKKCEDLFNKLKVIPYPQKEY